MSGTIPLGEVAKSVTSRFNLVGLLPSALFAGGIGFLILSNSFHGAPDIHLLVVRLRAVNIFFASLVFLAVLAVALVVHPFQLLLVRTLEGYWDETPVLRHLRFIGVELNRRRRARLREVGGDTARLARRYPERIDDFLPTRLGNVLRAAERRAGQKHGFTGPAEMLPRIYPYISAALDEGISDARDTLDIACRMCVVFWLLAVVSAIVFAIDGAIPASSGAWLCFPAVQACLGVISYRGAIRAAEAYGQFLFLVFDLHRQDLIRGLGYEPPDTPEEEVRLIRALTAWLVGGDLAPEEHWKIAVKDPAASSPP